MLKPSLSRRPVPLGRFPVPFLAVLFSILLLPACGRESPIRATPSETLSETLGDTPLEHAAKHQDPTYVCPMHPQIVRDAPGTCPICGMNLVEQRQDPLMDDESEGRPQVRLDAAAVQNLGVRTARVERGTLWKSIRTLGRVEYDETRLAHLHPRADGFIQGLVVRAEGEPVRKGQELAQLYAPDILSAQVDFLQALAPQPAGVAQVKTDKARNILRLLEVPESVIGDIERRRETRQTIPVLSPIDGVVTEMMAREGMYVTAASAMFTIADLSRVWVLADIFEHQIDWLAPGLTAEIRLPARPGQTWTGKVDYLYPALDPKSRTLRVRLVFENPELALKPNLFANVVIEGGPRRGVLKIPSEALIVTGERASVVKAFGEGRFQPIDVVVGMQSGGEVEILSGLDEGDEIVVSGQFLIDSESTLSNLGRGSSMAPGGDHVH
ncbi:efflux RND transporter periplasmic adaptor subunit [uncultured Thiocystis sp.]|uniref:efflux RND transporter periplasmic adaptor subunit n=1 Tax=uncultured Thiocystis sp. TaxID=1202134 RepID=UPI0025CE9094|nr:efflux RND transporter periplasmic adaptor subunit [uncultured Thiocystis sp.]